jgi:hypothetical protein
METEGFAFGEVLESALKSEIRDSMTVIAALLAAQQRSAGHGKAY